MRRSWTDTAPQAGVTLVELLVAISIVASLLGALVPAIRAAREVWLLAAGEDKANAAAMVLSGAGEIQAPAAGAYGRSRTLWLLDRAAAAQLPRQLYPPASA